MARINQADDPKLVTMQLLMDEAGRTASFHELDPFGERHGISPRASAAGADCFAEHGRASDIMQAIYCQFIVLQYKTEHNQISVKRVDGVER